MLITRKLEINYSKRSTSMNWYEQGACERSRSAGVKSVPALVMNGAAFHINFGAGIEALK
jgi:hypothetical protein